MRTLAWDRPARVAEIGNQIWSYVSPASQREGPGILVAAALLGWPESDVSKMAELQFLLCDEVREFVRQLPALARRLGTTSARDEEWSSERIRGSVHWGRTLTGRRASGNPHLYVTAPVERAYQTAENELLVHVLDAVVRLASTNGWNDPGMRSEPATTIQGHLVEATKWQKSRMLSTIERVRPTPRSLSRIAGGRTGARYSGVLAAHHKLAALVERLDRDAIRSAVEEIGLVTAKDPILFELLTLFRVIDALKVHGWGLKPLYLFHGRIHTYGIREDGRRLDLWYQSSPANPGDGSGYRQVLTAHGFQRGQDLRPDLVLHWTGQHGEPRTLLVECKLSTTGGVREAARSALFDLFAYRQAFSEALAQTAAPYGLGVAWGAGLAPRHDQDVMLCTPEGIEVALRTTCES